MTTFSWSGNGKNAMRLVWFPAGYHASIPRFGRQPAHLYHGRKELQLKFNESPAEYMCNPGDAVVSGGVKTLGWTRVQLAKFPLAKHMKRSMYVTSIFLSHTFIYSARGTYFGKQTKMSGCRPQSRTQGPIPKANVTDSGSFQQHKVEC